MNGSYLLTAIPNCPVLVSLLALLVALTATGEPITVTGSITDKNGKPLAGASVMVVGTRQGSSADENGNFRLTNVPSDGKLVASHIGYQSQEIALTGQSLFRLTLGPQPTSELTIKKFPKRILISSPSIRFVRF